MMKTVEAMKQLYVALSSYVVSYGYGFNFDEYLSLPHPIGGVMSYFNNHNKLWRHNRDNADFGMSETYTQHMRYTSDVLHSIVLRIVSDELRKAGEHMTEKELSKEPSIKEGSTVMNNQPITNENATPTSPNVHSDLKSLLDSVDAMEQLVVKSYTAFTTYNINLLMMVDVKEFSAQLQAAMQNITSHSGHVFKVNVDPHERDEIQDLTNAPSPLSYEAVSTSLLDVLAGDILSFLRDCGFGDAISVRDFVKNVTHMASITGRLRSVILREITDNSGLTKKQESIVVEPKMTMREKLDYFGASISKEITGMSTRTNDSGQTVVVADKAFRDFNHWIAAIYSTFGIGFSQTPGEDEVEKIISLIGNSEDCTLAAQSFFGLANMIRQFNKQITGGYISMGEFTKIIGHLLYNIGQLRILVTLFEREPKP